MSRIAGLAAVGAIVLALAGIGSAASPNVCVTATSCISESVAPHFLTAASNHLDSATWNDAVSITKFENESGPSGATATHAVLRVTFTAKPPQTVQFVKIKSTSAQAGNGTPLAGATCASTWTNDPTAAGYNSASNTTLQVACGVGSVAGGGIVRMVVRFATDTSMNSTADGTRIAGAVTYGESGNDNPTGPNGQINDNHVAFDTLTVGGNLQGGCFNSTATVAGGTTTQLTSTTVGQTGLAGWPCSPASAGVETGTASNRPSTFTRDISFTEFLPVAGDGRGTVLVDFLTALPKGFVLKELVNFAAPTLASSWAEVKKCGLPTTLDSCISDTKNLPKGGFRFILSVAGTLVDPRYSG